VSTQLAGCLDTPTDSQAGRWLLIAKAENLERGDGVGTVAVTLVGPIACFTRVCQQCIGASTRFDFADCRSDPSAT